VGPGRVDTDAIDLGAQAAELFDSFSELGKLVGSTRAEVEKVRQQHDWSAAEHLGQAHGLSAVDRQFEIGGRVAGSEIWHTLRLFHPGPLRQDIGWGEARLREAPCSFLEPATP
jgi:hypothetical protein